MYHEIRCNNLSNLFQESETRGFITLDSKKPPNEAQLAIIASLGKVQYSEESDVKSLEVPVSNEAEDQYFIRQARAEAEKSPCWAGRVGSIVVDQEGKIVARGFNHPQVTENFCSQLNLDPNEVRNLLKVGEKLDFCQAIHDVADVITSAANRGFSIRKMRWYLSLEPCPECATLLIGVEPETVYFSVGIGRTRYYNSHGLERLAAASIPLKHVEIPS